MLPFIRCLTHSYIQNFVLSQISWSQIPSKSYTVASYDCLPICPKIIKTWIPIDFQTPQFPFIGRENDLIRQENSLVKWQFQKKIFWFLHLSLKHQTTWKSFVLKQLLFFFSLLTSLLLFRHTGWLRGLRCLQFLTIHDHCYSFHMSLFSRSDKQSDSQK